jgi:transcriptional regulator with XRE-family HTH domain
MAVAAQFDILANGKNARGTTRHRMRLRVRGAPASGDASEVVIHNLSASGMLLESASPLAVGDEIAVELPEAAGSTAKVVWASEQYFGCVFDRQLPAAAVSAAQLRSEPPLGTPRLPDAGANAGPSGETFGARLQRLRRDRGLTLVEFSRRAKVSRPTVWSWEADRSTPRRSKTRILLEVLGVTEDELYGKSGAERQGNAEAGAPGQGDTLQRAISEAKERVAELAGTVPDKIKLIIEI